MELTGADPTVHSLPLCDENLAASRRRTRTRVVAAYSEYMVQGTQD